MSPTVAGVVMVVSLVLALALAHRPVGDYLYRVLEPGRPARVERGIYRLVGVDAIGVGDDTRAKDATWRSYQRRELVANMKMVVDVVVQREVGQAGFDSAVQDALARHS